MFPARQERSRTGVHGHLSRAQEVVGRLYLDLGAPGPPALAAGDGREHVAPFEGMADSWRMKGHAALGESSSPDSVDDSV